MAPFDHADVLLPRLKIDPDDIVKAVAGVEDKNVIGQIHLFIGSDDSVLYGTVDRGEQHVAEEMGFVDGIPIVGIDNDREASLQSSTS
jgi:hypothetical protein